MVSRFMIAAVLGVALFVAPDAASAHGVGYRESDLRPISLEFGYSTGDPMSYLEADVFSPKDEKFAYQTGRTDEGGRFAFTPDVAGTWRVVVKDEEGHRVEAKIDVTPELLKGGVGVACPVILPQAAAPQGMELWLRAGLGVSLLLNLAALVAFARRRRTV